LRVWQLDDVSLRLRSHKHEYEYEYESGFPFMAHRSYSYEQNVYGHSYNSTHVGHIENSQ